MEHSITRGQRPSASENQVVEPPKSVETIHHLVLELLSQRGFVSEEAIEGWVYPKLKDIRSPEGLKDLDLACERLLRALKANETIAVYGDYDLDGTSGVALLLKALGDMGFKDLIPYQPKRLQEGYGLHPEACERLASESRVSLILTVDVGITAHKAAQRCRELGVDLIITDHHLPEGGRPEAYAVINPSQDDCRSGLEHLCGAGVAFYLCLGLLSRLRRIQSNLRVDPKSWLDVFTIATITDMVPLVAENRVLVKHGLEALGRTQRPALKKLLGELDLLGRPLSSQDVALRFAPKLNALSRLEGELRPLSLYLETNDQRSEELVQKVLLTNKERRKLQSEGESLALKVAQAEPSSHFHWIYHSDIHQGVLGLVATRLAQQLGKPSFIGALSNCGKYIVGSARRPDDFPNINLVDALSHASRALLKFGGHAPAAGFELLRESGEEFGELLGEFFDDLKPLEQKTSKDMSFDLEVRLRDLDEYLMTWLEHLEPFGVGFPAPIFKVVGAKLAQVRELKGGHLRLSLVDGLDGRTGVWFSPPPEILTQLTREKTSHGGAVEVFCELETNYFRGRRGLQLMVKNLTLL